MVMLKYSPDCFNFFYDCIYQNSAHRDILPTSTSLIGEDIQFKTQVGSIQFETSRLLSVLITNDEYVPNIEIKPIKRGATYDAVITMGEDLSVIIETKPNRDHVWDQQLCPSAEHVSEDVEVIDKPVVLTWHTIISWLTKFIRSDRHNYAERQVASDFLGLIQSNFSHLNPFNRLDLCGGNHSLIYKRIESILKSIVVDEELIKFHYGWGFYIELPPEYKAIRKIGLILAKNNRIELSLYFADTQGQGRALYPTNFDLDLFEQQGWFIKPNFHFAFMTSNKIWFQSINKVRYIQYWNENSKQLRQLPSHDKVKSYLSNLVEKDIVIDQPEQMQKIIYNSNMNKINVCPGLGFLYRYEIHEAEQLDREGKFESELKSKIQRCLKEVLNKEPAFLKDHE